MTTYTAIPNSELAVDAPARSINALQLRDNPIAITEGASGAPRVQTAGLQAGNLLASVAYVARSLSTGVDGNPNSITYVTVFNPGTIQGAGVVRVRFKHKTLVGAQAAFARILLFSPTSEGVGVQQIEYSTNSTSDVQREFDVSINWNDAVGVEFRAESVAGNSTYRDLTLSADNIFGV